MVVTNLVVDTVILVTSSVLCVRYLLSRSWGSCDSSKRLDDKTVVITGANSGIGKALAKQLAPLGANIIFACRDELSTNSVIEDIKSNCKNLGRLEYKHLDLNSFSSVRSFARNLIESGCDVNFLINNAGVYQSPFEINEDGFERNLAVNHLSSALLSLLLLPKLNELGDKLHVNSQIIFVSSSLYKNGRIRDIDFVAKLVSKFI